MRKRHIQTVMALAIAVLLGSAGTFAAKSSKNSEDARAKARYFYVEGSAALAEGNSSEAYELIKKAATIDPSYAEANYTYGLMRMTLRNDTLATPTEIEKSIALMRPYIDTYPKETEEAMNYSYIVARAGDVDEAIRVAERSDTLAGSTPNILLTLAQYYSAKQEADKAISTLERYERIEGNDPDISLRKFALLFMKGDTLGLLNESARLVRENPLSTDYLLIRCHAMEDIELPDSALVCY